MVIVLAFFPGLLYGLVHNQIVLPGEDQAIEKSGATG